METRALVVALISILNFASESLEKLVSEDEEGGGKSGKDKPKRASRAKDKDEDGPSEDDVVDAVKGAQKVLESADVKKILKKYGKADRATEVEEEHRQAVIDALEKAVEEAE